MCLQFSNGWSFGEQTCETSKIHNLLKPYKALSDKVVGLKKHCSISLCFLQLARINLQHRFSISLGFNPCLIFNQDKEAYCWPVRESLKTMLSWGWSIDRIREGDPASLHNKSRRISQASQVQTSADIFIPTIKHKTMQTKLYVSIVSCSFLLREVLLSAPGP